MTGPSNLYQIMEPTSFATILTVGTSGISCVSVIVMSLCGKV